MTIGEAMRQARIQAGLTLKQAAPLLGVDEGTLSRYERDQVEAPLPVLAKACRVYRSMLPAWAYMERAVRMFREIAA